MQEELRQAESSLIRNLSTVQGTAQKCLTDVRQNTIGQLRMRRYAKYLFTTTFLRQILYMTTSHEGRSLFYRVS